MEYREVAIGKQHKERFYHFQDNGPAESESGVPFSAATEEGGGAAHGEPTSGGAAGWEERAVAQGGLGSFYCSVSFGVY